MSKNLPLFCILCLCCSFMQPKYCKFSDKIVSCYTKQLCQEEKLILIGKGGAMMDDIKEIFLHYVSFEKMDVGSARNLYVKIIEEYLRRYNSDEKVRPYLHNFPFTAENIDLHLSFYDENDRSRTDGSVAYIFKVNGDVFFRGDTGKEFYSLAKEPYEVALEIVKKGAASKSREGT